MRWIIRTAALLITLWVLLSVTLLPRMAISVGDNPVTSTPADVSLAYENVIVESEGLSLEGWWMPAESPRAVLLFVHGAGSNRTSWFVPSLEFYRALVERQISVLTIDLRNHGNSPKSDGTLAMGLEEWPDVIAMDRWLDTRVGDQLPRFGMGVSMGGATLIQAMSRGLELDRAILFDPALATQDSLAHGAWISTGLPPAMFRLYAWATTALYGLPSGDADAASLARTLRVPTLLLQDIDDPITRAEYAQALAADNAHVTLALSPPTSPESDCVAGKGRWGSHAGAFKCHQEWFLSELDGFLGTEVSMTSAPAAR